MGLRNSLELLRAHTHNVMISCTAWTRGAQTPRRGMVAYAARLHRSYRFGAVGRRGPSWQAVGFVHAKNCIHRDVKGDNFMMDFKDAGWRAPQCRG